MLHFRGQIGNNVSSELAIATFNVRGLTSHTRQNLLAGDLAARKVTLCCLQETKCATGLQESCRGYKLICLPTKCRHYGLGFAVAESVADNILRYWSVSERIAVLQLRISSNSVLTLVNVYAPHSGLTVKDIEIQDYFFCDLANVIATNSSSALLYIAGDFNSKLGLREQDETFIGRHSRGHRNMNGEAMAHFLDAHNLFACNTAFQHPARHKTTYQQKRKDNTTGLDVVIYNMIDYIICRQSQQSLLLDARSYAGTVLNSDHRIVVSRIRLSRVFGMWGRKPQNFTKPKHYSVDLLSDANESSKYKQHLTSCMNELSDEFEAAETAQTQLKYVVKAIEEAAASSIGITPPSRSQSQKFCPEINRMSHEHKMLRLRIDNTQDAEISNALKQKRNRLQHAIRRKALENATTKLDQKIEEIERLHDGAKMFKSVRLLYRTQYRQPTIHDDQGRAIRDQETYGKHVSDFFSEQFQGDVKQGITAFTGEPLCNIRSPHQK